MSETNLKLRSPDYDSMTVTAPTAGYAAGQMVKLEDTVCVIVEAALVGVNVTAITACDKIILPKTATTGVVFTKGDKVYFDATAAKVTNVASDNTLIGRANETVIFSATEVEVDFNGKVAA